MDVKFVEVLERHAMALEELAAAIRSLRPEDPGRVPPAKVTAVLDEDEFPATPAPAAPVEQVQPKAAAASARRMMTAAESRERCVETMGKLINAAKAEDIKRCLASVDAERLREVEDMALPHLLSALERCLEEAERHAA
jgi:hypothetical protein